MTDLKYGEQSNQEFCDESSMKKHKKSKKKHKEHTKNVEIEEPSKECLSEKSKSKKHKRKKKHKSSKDFPTDDGICHKKSRIAIDSSENETRNSSNEMTDEMKSVIGTVGTELCEIVKEPQSLVENYSTGNVTERGKKHKRKRHHDDLYQKPEIDGEGTECVQGLVEVEDKIHKRHKKNRSKVEGTESIVNFEEEESVNIPAKKHKKDKKHRNDIENIECISHFEEEESINIPAKKHKKDKKHKNRVGSIDNNSNFEEEESLKTHAKEHKKDKKHRYSFDSIECSSNIVEEESINVSAKKHKKDKKHKTIVDSIENNSNFEEEESSNIPTKKHKKHKKDKKNVECLESIVNSEEEESIHIPAKKHKKHKKHKESKGSNNSSDIDKDTMSPSENHREISKRRISAMDYDRNTDNEDVVLSSPSKKHKKDSESKTKRKAKRDNDQEVFEKSDEESKENEEIDVVVKEEAESTGDEDCYENQTPLEEQIRNVCLENDPTYADENDENDIVVKQDIDNISDENETPPEEQNENDCIQHNTAHAAATNPQKKVQKSKSRGNVLEVDQKTLEIIHQKNDVTYRNYKKDLKHFQDIGLKINCGKWTYMEDEQLKRNWKTFFEEFPYPEEKRYYFLSATDCSAEERSKIRKLKSHYDFFIRLGDGIQRMLYSVYVRARYLFNPVTNKGKFTAEEEKKLEKLKKQYADDWKTIGESLDRSALAVSTKSSQMKENKVTGKWTSQENNQLIQAVKDTLGTEDITHLYYDLPWSKIAEKIPTRDLMQCRWHWLNSVQWQVNKASPSTKKNRFDEQDKASLISLITDMKPTSEADIDWVYLMEQFENVGSPQYIKAKWYKLRMKVPDYKIKSFDEILDYLVETVLPKLRSKQS